jgi:phosphoribosyl-ATP pyrophosphohydrolase/phosphoribosyl-AMP cyclohydrolase
MNGLVPAVAQDAKTGAVLMLGFMNSEALTRTIAEKQAVFFSRSKNRLWKKGETSGHVLNVVSIHPDCDNDSVLLLVNPVGPTCHTGAQNCFSTRPEFGANPVINGLIATIRERKRDMPEGSYTTQMFKEGVKKIAQKLGEEAVELAIAAQYDDRQRTIEETADLLYHTLVLLEETGITLEDVEKELGKRKK